MAEASDKRRRVSARVAREADRIGDLPDDLIRRVLSQLSSREAVHTSLLAQRWRHLWRSVPIINVSFVEFDRMAPEDEIKRGGMFKKFVNSLLMHRDQVGLEEFRVVYSSSTDGSSGDGNQLISAQAVNSGEPIELDTAVLSSSYLKRLHISSATLDPGFFDQLQTGCSAMEHLFLYDCRIKDLEIFSNTLKVLILSEVVFTDQASISTPSLVSLSSKVDLREGRLPRLENMASLQTASVLLWGNITACDADTISQLLANLSNVASLDFCYRANKVTMENNFRWCPKFPNLTNLTLDAWCVHAEFYALIVFLQKSPSLKKLTLRLDQGNVAAIIGELEDRSFTCEQLEVVQIICSEISELLPRVAKFLRDSGIRPDQMHML